jgi:hypothetical protein
MRDPDEGLTAEGMIKTGVKRNNVPVLFEPIVHEVTESVKTLQGRLSLSPVSLYLYGSVAVGTAVSPWSDVDFLTVGIPADLAKDIASDISSQFSSICRGVEIAPAHYTDFQTESDESYGGRVFLRHYCVHLYGQNLVSAEQSFPGDVKAARGFNGDIKIFYDRWCSQKSQTDPSQLGKRIARKTLLAVAGLVSMHDHIWTTDRQSSALRWAELNPKWQADLKKLSALSEDTKETSILEIDDILSPEGVVHSVVKDFENNIGLWR